MPSMRQRMVSKVGFLSVATSSLLLLLLRAHLRSGTHHFLSKAEPTMSKEWGFCQVAREISIERKGESADDSRCDSMEVGSHHRRIIVTVTSMATRGHLLVTFSS
jgi:hypothetical protein